MSWAKLDDSFFTHPKVVDLTKDQKLLYLAGLLYSAANLTDGKLTRAAVRIAAATVDVNPADASELVNARLWDQDGAGYIVHDFGDYNPPGDIVKARRDELSAIRSEVGKKGADARWQNGKPDGKNYGKPDGKPDGKGHGNFVANGMAPSYSRPESESESRPEDSSSTVDPRLTERELPRAYSPPREAVGLDLLPPFRPPTVAEAEAYFDQYRIERELGEFPPPNPGYRSQADMFVDHYSTRNWVIRGEKADDWRGLARGWIGKIPQFLPATNRPSAPQKFIPTVRAPGDRAKEITEEIRRAKGGDRDR